MYLVQPRRHFVLMDVAASVAEDFVILGILGQGSYGAVLLAEKGGSRCALKR